MRRRISETARDRLIAFILIAPMASFVLAAILRKTQFIYLAIVIPLGCLVLFFAVPFFDERD